MIHVTADTAAERRELLALTLDEFCETLIYRHAKGIAAADKKKVQYKRFIK